MIVINEVLNCYLNCFCSDFIIAVEEVYISSLNIKIYLGAIVVSAGRILVFLNLFPKHLPFSDGPLLCCLIL